MIARSRLVAHGPAIRETGVQQISGDLAREHPVLKSRAGRIAERLPNKDGVEVIDHRVRSCGVAGIAGDRGVQVRLGRSSREMVSPSERT